MKLTLDNAGAQALREFASAIPIAIENIVSETDILISVYGSVAENLGEHNQDFNDLLMHIKKAQQNAADAISELPPRMERTAEKIEAYVASRPTID